MPFNIDYYLSEFEDNITFLDLSNKHLKILPDLSRFTNLRRLDCQFNRLIHLQHLPISLIVLNCSHNRLIQLPELPPKLRKLYCSNNQLIDLPNIYHKPLRDLNCSFNDLTQLPQLNLQLKKLDCSFNNITSIPNLPQSLQGLSCDNNELYALPLLPESLKDIVMYENPVSDIFYENMLYNDNIESVRPIAKILYNFKHMYYSLKFKNKFRKILWEQIREPHIKNHYSPENLQDILNRVGECDDVQLYQTINNW